MMFENIYCLGDSHISVFSNKNEVCDNLKEHINGKYKIFPVYGTLAYNLGEDNYSNRQYFLNILTTHNINENDLVVIMFGEIDCRLHILKQKIKQNITLKDSVFKCVNNYFKFIIYLKKQYNIHVIFPHLSRMYQCNNSDKPWITGSIKERYITTKLFNTLLRTLCLKNDIAYIDIFDDICVWKKKTIVFDTNYFLKSEQQKNNGRCMHLGGVCFDMLNKRINLI